APAAARGDRAQPRRHARLRAAAHVGPGPLDHRAPPTGRDPAGAGARRSAGEDRAAARARRAAPARRARAARARARGYNRAMRRALASGPVAGAVVGAALFALDFAGGDVGFMGLRDPRAIAVVMERARAAAVAEQLYILLALVVVCAAFGAVGALAGRAWDWARDRFSPSGAPPLRRLARGAAAALVGHALFFARGVIAYPQLYSAHLYDR